MLPARSISLVLPALLVLVAACGSSTEPSRRAAELELSTPSSMVVGERAIATVRAKTNEGCIFDSPCFFSTRVEVRSSRPDIIRLDRDRVGTQGSTPGEFELTALVQGSATVSAHVDGVSQSRQVDVVPGTEIR